MTKNFSEIWIKIPNILLPKKDIDLHKRAVVACDQYTSEPEYRQEVSKQVWDNPSTLNIIYPEVYLEESDKPERIAKIQENMTKYLNEWILEDHWECLILIDRKTSHTNSRKWLILALDLEAYDYSPESQTLIRATEWTVIDRLPPRIQIRKDASIESPHIMVLIDDENRTVIEPLFENISNYQKVYDTELMMNWWHIKWYKINDDQSISQIISAITNLGRKDVFQNKYNVWNEKWVLLFAMWDGNHSLATAKAIREEKKINLTEEEKLDHPSRFALVEIVNVHDEWLEFEPIHRVLFNVNPETLFWEIKNSANLNWSSISIQLFDSIEDMKSNTRKSDTNNHNINFVYEWKYGIMTIQNPKLNLEVGNLQYFLDEYMRNHPESKIDYVHWQETTEKLAIQKWNIWFRLPIMNKKDFFKTVVIDWVLPRKTFSMWEAEEKRFYLECRKIK